ncbi:cysteine ABC transporter substrate-binding protein [Bordetella trematum]|uniref:Solute-binding protein n=1 Tax=Bordetella trematum TaxID=123899 RepID=A0A157NHE4_9BORD|nr:ABC transporter substrate-binding protein [Bordetella trematum]AUL46487.1 cysteine ABC transporter substrate-binding protein [Bordetella trematum]AZR93282.1 cysteine ABC transporter substrate-binding protein [Bordetella trematum]NNH20598.1 ABC transporter substrate-binding protein [Bordetella trematum]QIM71860.1 transporter substrate-binding domain-containing protein [Bordetella trematum]SAI20735.1 solute-binding protein [Bordetella trematum]
MKKWIVTCVASIGLAAALAPVAQAATPEEIKARGKFICGTMGTAEPFSFQDPKTRAIVGYEVDMCKEIADSLGVPLEIKLIAVEARIPELIAGRVDVVAANLGWSPERAQQIDYSHQHFVSLQKVLARDNDQDLSTPADLAGKRVSAVRGSSSEQGARKFIPDVDPVTFKDPSGAFLALQQGKVRGFVGSELMLAKLRQQAAGSAVPVKILEPALFVEPWGVGVRRGDEALLKQVNQVLDGLEASGKATQIFDKWFGPDTQFNMKRDFRIEAIKG